MLQSSLNLVKKSWILILVLLLGVLSAYTNHPIYGAPAATPTPDVQTVPKPELLATPTNTPFPTPTPNSEDSSSGSSGPVVPTQPDDNNDNNDPDDNDGNENNNNTNNNSNTPGANATSGATSGPGASTTAGATQADTPGLNGVINVVTLNLRRGPGTTAHIIDTLFMNDQITILGRDSGGKWLYICCGSRAKLTGWVSAQFVTPKFPAGQTMDALPLVGASVVNSPTITSPTITSTAGTTTTAQLAATQQNLATGDTTATPILLEMRPMPAFAWQGQTLALSFVVHNNSDQPIANVRLLDDLPEELAFVEATIGAQGTISHTGTAQNGPLLAIHWPELGANERITATVTVRIESDTPDGAMIDNLAVINTEQGNKALAGITISMPPTLLPQFR